MATQYIKRTTTPFPAVSGGHKVPIYVDSDDNILKIIPAGSGTTEVQVVDASSTQTLTNKTLTSPALNTPVVIGSTRDVDASGGTTRTLTAATSGSVNLFDSAAGITYTLPTPVVGLTYDFVWTVAQTSSAHIVITATTASEFLKGGVVAFSGESVTPSATLGPYAFAANGTTHVKYSSNATTTGSGLGTWLRFIAVSTTVWHVSGVMNSPSGSIVTPFLVA